MEQVYPFNIAGAGEVLTINPRTLTGGYLELQVTEKGPVYLFTGAISAEDAKAALKGSTPRFEVGATVDHPARVRVNSNMGEFTVFSANAGTVGFVKIIECGCDIHP